MNFHLLIKVIEFLNLIFWYLIKIQTTLVVFMIDLMMIVNYGKKKRIYYWKYIAWLIKLQ